ncbi:MAG: class I SAM-dependent methyltransferase [Acidobacteria bacterium]|nr:class I SAM-dependent methyltransferase [Acidobacteriota bacterium]
MDSPRHFLARALRRVARAVDSERGQPIDISDDYVTWVCFANAGMLNRGNLYCFDYALRNLPSTDPIVEIGSFCGLSTNLLVHYMRKHGATNHLFTCDPWDFERSGLSSGENLPGSPLSFVEYRNFVKETYVRNVQMFSRDHLPHSVECSSDEFFDAWRKKLRVRDVFGRDAELGGQISFCYVDGNHSEEFARRDFDNCNEFLAPGGFVLFDDSAKGLPFHGVQRVVAEVSASCRYEMVACNPNHLFRKLAE